MQVVFLLGRSPKWSKKGASRIRAEMDRYNDIVEAGEGGTKPRDLCWLPSTDGLDVPVCFFSALITPFHQTLSMATAT